MYHTNENQLTKFKRLGDLSLFKFIEYLPSMVLSNISALLMVTVNGLVVGNFLGNDALAAVTVFAPLILIVGAFSVMVSYGIGISLSTSIGSNEVTQIHQVKTASFWLIICCSVFAAIFQIPLFWILLKAYRLPDSIYALSWQYAFGAMLSTPLSMISTVGSNMLQISGKPKILTRLTVLEGFVNLILNLLFVGLLHTGIAGASLGTACANFIRAGATLICLLRYTDMICCRRCSYGFAEYISILKLGVPNAVSSLLNAFQDYLFMQILILVFGKNAGTIDAICTFSFSVLNGLTMGILDALRPIAGLLSGAGDRDGLKILMRQTAQFIAGIIGAITLANELFPGFLFTLHGIKDIPPGGIASFRIFSLYLLPYAFANFFLLFLVTRKDVEYTTKITVISNIFQPLVGLLIMKVCSAPWVYLSYSITAVLLLIPYMLRYRCLSEREKREAETCRDTVLYMSVKPHEAVEASRAIREFADEQRIHKKIAYRIALCMEEMVAYVEYVNKKNIAAQIIIRFKESGDATFAIMDNGKCIAYQMEEDREKGLSTNNYVLMQRLAKDVKYQYVLNMNYTILEFA